jgi:hypothetical protein
MQGSVLLLQQIVLEDDLICIIRGEGYYYAKSKLTGKVLHLAVIC